MNEAFIIDKNTRDELIKEDPKSEQLIRPILRGKDIKRYEYDFKEIYLIVAHNGNKVRGIPPININNYPAIKEHLNKFLEKLKKRQDKGDTPYNLRNCVYMDEFSKPKIIYREISTNMDACFVQQEYFVNNKCYIITGEHLLYLLGYLNSNLFNKILLKDANQTGGKGKDFLNKIYLPIPPQSVESEINRLVLGVQSERNESKKRNLSLGIENAFSKIFNLSDEEISYIHSSEKE